MPHPPKPRALAGKKKKLGCSQSTPAPNSFRYGRSTVSIFSFANGALGEHRRQDQA